MAWKGNSVPGVMIQPDYQGGSIVNLMRSLADACGAAPLPYEPLRGLDVAAFGSRHIVLLVLDGLGYNHLQRAARGGFLQRHHHSRLTSVFPSTTASAVTTFLTGLAPQQHALTGWHMYFSELDAIAAVLPLTPRGAGRFSAEAGELPGRLFGYAPFANRIARPAAIVSPQYLVNSEFSTYHAGGASMRGFKGLAGLFGQIEAALREAHEPSYIYAYYPEIDALAHQHGVSSRQVATHLAAVDEAFGRFLEAIRGAGALVLAIADHGFIDSPPERVIELERHPRLAELVARPLCGERRAAYCYVRNGCAAQFETYVRQHLAECATLRRSTGLIEGGWFGPGTPDPRLAGRTGDYTLMMKADWTITDWLAGEKRHPQIGVHGGISADEMFVPLIVAEA
jgi:hypothetical protein